MLTQDQIDSVIAEVLAQEGGLEQDDPKDPSTRTNFGITQATADDYNLGDVKDLTQAKAVEFYRQWFGEHKIDMIPDENTFGLVADAMTNHSPARAIEWLQAALGVVPDGVIGPQTIAAMKGDWAMIYAHILSQRIQFYGKLASEHPYNCQWINGWLRRACTFLYPPAQWG